MRRIDLAAPPPVKRLVVSRWPQFLAILVTLAGFLIAMLAGFLGTPVGSRNFTIVVVWIGWWALLILVTVPLLGRGWCSICPIPVLGEWVQRGAILGPQPGRGWGLDRRWPRGLRNIWLQNAGFVMLALFAVVILTQPLVTSLVLLALFVLAFGASLFFERRAFCSYLCPVGGFIGLYSQMAPVALRVKDTAICVSHREKTCYTGNAEGYGCPWGVFPAGLVKNINCGLCFECVRACPYDNIAFYLRPLGADLAQARGRKLDEAYKAFIMLGSALLYSAVMLGPWGWLKSAAFAVGSRDWFLYALAFSLFVLLVVPGAFLAAVLAGRALAGLRVSLRKGFTHLAYALVPLGLAAWIAFSLSFVFANLSYVWPALSDPMGWGWNLIGTAGVLWTPYLSGLVPYVQVGVMVAGLAWSAGTAHGIVRQLGANEATSGREAVGALPVVAFNLAATILLLWLLVG